MSGMYNMVFGVHPLAGGLVQLILDLDVKEVPRFRDCYPVQYGDEAMKIELVTRAGGPNADEFVTEIEALEAHDAYLDSQDDPFDSTYRVFWFSFPPDDDEQMQRLLPLLEKHPEAVYKTTLDERWKLALDALKAPPEEEKPKIIIPGGESS